MGTKRTILILEDNNDRIVGFKSVLTAVDPKLKLKIWRDAPSMCAECAEFFPNACLISLDHDLDPAPGVSTDPGTGMDVARFLGDFLPACPVLVHSSNTDRAWSMCNELRFADWIVDRVEPLRAGWIQTSWLRRVRELLAIHSNTWKAEFPADHSSRVERLQLSLDALGLGDALGQMLFSRPEIAPRWLVQPELPAGPWFHTDDTEMAISIASVLKGHGFVHQDALAKRFARRFERDPERGYGKMTRWQMREIIAGANWKETSANAFGGQGSMGNGSAMRVAPLGAYFAEDLDRCVTEAQASSVVTHSHPEGIAGAIAVAVAAAMAWQLRSVPLNQRAGRFLQEILKRTPESQVRRGIFLASHVPAGTDIQEVAKSLGNGSMVTAPDTVPFCVWVAAHYPDNFVQALGQTICVGGDCDTNAAIVGGIVGLSAGREAIPADWLNSREPVSI